MPQQILLIEDDARLAFEDQRGTGLDGGITLMLVGRRRVTELETHHMEGKRDGITPMAPPTKVAFAAAAAEAPPRN